MNPETSTAYSQDYFSREKFAEKLERFTLTEHHFVEGSLVISLHAPFGSGKSTFIRMWTEDLSFRRTKQPELPRPVVINAWESDYCGDPLIAILAGLMAALEDTSSPTTSAENAASLREAIKDVGWMALSLANGVVSKNFGVDVIGAGKLATEKQQERDEDPSTDLLESYSQKHQSLSKLKDALKAAFGGDEPRAIVFIDELDRCRPDYAVSYLETIKHIFDVHGIVFILCVDEHQLRSATTVLFGAELNFREYYRKFAHRSVQLPPAEKNGLEKIAQAYTLKYLRVEGKRWSILVNADRELDSVVEMITALALTPRQIQEVFRILGHVFSTNPTSSGSQQWAWIHGTIFMATIRIANQPLYERFRSGRATIRELGECVTRIFLERRHQEWWFNLLACGIKTENNWEAAVQDELHRLGWDPSTPPKKIDLNQRMSDFAMGWGRRHFDSTSGIVGIYKRIESMASFAT